MTPSHDEFHEWFANSKIVDAHNRPRVMHHGASVVFDAFDTRFVNGSNGRSEGLGFYFTSDRKIAEGYGKTGQVWDVYLSVRQPLAYDSPAFKPRQIEAFLLRAAQVEADAEGFDVQDGFLSNIVDTYSLPIQKAVAEAAKIFTRDPTALDQVSGLVGAGVNAAIVNQALRESLGYDGYVSHGFENRKDAGGVIVVVMEPNQIRRVADCELALGQAQALQSAQTAKAFLEGLPGKNPKQRAGRPL